MGPRVGAADGDWEPFTIESPRLSAAAPSLDELVLAATSGACVGRGRTPLLHNPLPVHALIVGFRFRPGASLLGRRLLLGLLGLLSPLQGSSSVQQDFLRLFGGQPSTRDGFE